MHRSTLRLAALAGLAMLGAFSLSGCGAASKIAQPAAISQAQSNDVAGQVGTLMFADGSSSPVPAGLIAQGPAGLAAIRHAGALSATADTTLVRNGVAWTFAIHWYDALGAEQPQYDPTSTVRMHADSHASGTFLGPQGTATLGTSEALDVSGISALQDTLTTNAVRQDTLAYAVSNANGSATFLAHCSGAFDNVVEAKPVSSNHPARGVAAWSLDVSKHLQSQNGSIDEHFAATVVVTFNGTHLVPLVVNGTYHFILDLDTGQVVPVAA
jgi:hypothetical protein